VKPATFRLAFRFVFCFLYILLGEILPDGIEYGLICKDLKTGDSVLVDNHHPKCPHVHINDREIS
jgi:hypothetical protein